MNRKPAILFLFFASGFSGLVYEVAWMRLLSVVFGNTVYATATVLAGFMGGLAIGSYLFGRLADRGGNLLRLYAVLELLVGVCALAVPLLLKILPPLYLWAARFSTSYHALSFGQALLVIGFLFLPTILMGGTLPILTKYLSREFSALGRNFSLLYGLNTFGAVLGCACAGLWLIGSVGVRATTWVAVAISTAVGVVAWSLSQRPDATLAAAPVIGPAPAPAPADAAGERPAWLVRLLLLLIAVSGFTAMAYEVLWMRVLVFLTGGTSYAFTVMLTTFLCGLAVGSVVIARFVDRSPRLTELFSGLQIILGLTVLATLVAVPLILGTLGSVLFHGGVLRYGDLLSFFLLQATVSLAFVFPGAVLMGLSFPVVAKLCTRSYDQAGSGIGTTYFADTIGCIAGSVAAGFVLIPLLGTLGSLRAMALVNLLVGAVALACVTGPSGLPRFDVRRCAALAVLVLLVGAVSLRSIPATTFADVFTAPESELVYLNEDIGGTVTIEQYKHYKTISINGVNVAGTDLRFQTTQKLQAHLATLLHPNPQRVMQIGFGSGGTAYAVTRHPVAKIDCVELTAAVLKARDLLRETNHGVLADPRVQVFVDDARSFMLKCEPGYDAILSDSIHPRRAGNGSLYSVDYFRLCRAKLKPDGIFSAWLPIYGLSLQDFQVTVRSLREVFPHVYLFHSPIGRNEWSIILGMNQPLKIDMDQLTARMNDPAVRQDLSLIYINRPEDLLASFLLGDANLAAFTGPSRVLNTDDFPYLEYVAPKSGIVTSRAGLLVPLYRELVKQREPVFPYLAPVDAPRLDTLRNCWDAMTGLLAGRLVECEPSSNAAAAKELFRQALTRDPGNAVAKNLIETEPIAGPSAGP